MTNMTHKSYLSNIILFVLLFSFFIAPAKPARAATLSRPPSNLGLVGYWPLDEGNGVKATDASGNGNTGDINGNPVWVNGKHGKALSFNGSSDYITMGDPTSLKPANNITFGSWFKTSSNNSDMTILRKRTYGYGLKMINGQSYCFVWENSGSNPAVISPLTYNDGKWHQSTCVYNSTGLYLYVDGNLVASSLSSNNSLYYQNDSVAIGRDAGASSSYFNGSIDDVRVYNRALSATEISKMYSSGQVTRKQTSSSGLVGYWSMDDNAGNKVTDSSGNNNVGTITGATWTTGKKGKALSFNGSDSVIDVGNPSNLVITGDVTVSAWINPNSLDPYYEKNIIVSGRRTETSQPYTLEVSSSNLCISFQTDNVSNGFSGWVVKCASTTIPLNQWSHIQVVRSGLNLYFYKNGQLVGSDSYLAGTIYTGNGVLIGKGYYGGSMYFNGLIDDVRIYNRVLSATEIQALYKQNQTIMNTSQVGKLTNGLVGYWSFNGKDVSGSTVYDRSGNGYNGTTTGATLTIGKSGQAMSFDGVNDYVEISNYSSLNPNLLTISAWAKSNTTLWNDYGFIVSKRDAYIIHPSQSSKSVSFYIYTNTWVAASCTPNIITDWTLYTMTWDGTNLKCFINGTQGGVTVPGGSINTSDTGVIQIGRDDGLARYFNGLIDEVRIYNRALSADEIKQLYNLGK